MRPRTALRLVARLAWANVDLFLQIAYALREKRLRASHRADPSARANPATTVDYVVEHGEAKRATTRTEAVELPYETLLARVVSDEGCASGNAHLACTAAEALAERFGRTRQVVQVLEETVTRSGRPACVQRQAVAALARLLTDDAQLALQRMASVTRRRLEWDAAFGDRALLQDIERRLAG